MILVYGEKAKVTDFNGWLYENFTYLYSMCEQNSYFNTCKIVKMHTQGFSDAMNVLFS